MKQMTSRQRVLTAFNHELPDRVPAWCGSSAEFWTKAKKQLNLDDEGLRLRFGDDFRRVFARYVGPNPPLSPKMHREFCLPYDKKINDALRRHGFLSVYHTCGGMMNILDLIVTNGTDASETLAPQGVGGNITEPQKVRKVFAGKIAMIGGMDQFHILTNGTKKLIKQEVRRLFEGFGRDGGYIMSASDHFFDAPVENIIAYAQAAKECVY